jgi:MoxR-like ATPase
LLAFHYIISRKTSTISYNFGLVESLSRMAYEGPRIYRAPYASDDAFSNFERTVLEGLSVDDVTPYSDRDFDSGPVRMWGTTVARSWRKIDPGDFIIFYRSGEYEHAAEVVGTERNEELGGFVWPNYEGEPWDCLIYLKQPVEINVESAPLHELAGYNVSHTQNFAPLNEMGLGAIRATYGSVEEFIYVDRKGLETQRKISKVTSDDGEPDLDVRTVPKVDVPESVLSGLFFPGSMDTEILDQVNSALSAGKHIVFIGPPGTGKTEIAQRVSEHLAENHSDVYSGYRTTTATADWSTFETVGGYMPGEASTDELAFSPGQVLRCFRHGGRQRNDLLVIDEINRSDIDKSFGQLFTLLAGQAVQLPFTVDGEEIEVIPAGNEDIDADDHRYVMPTSWRIFATMNSYDKTSLYEMSYAFMRRFAFVHVGAPDAETTDDWESLVRSYADVWNLDVGDDLVDVVAAVWKVTNGAASERKIGPALVEDMLRHVSAAGSPDAITGAITSYVFPQLEGVRGRERVITELASLDSVDRQRMEDRAAEILQVTLDE